MPRTRLERTRATDRCLLNATSPSFNPFAPAAGKLRLRRQDAKVGLTDAKHDGKPVPDRPCEMARTGLSGPISRN